MKKQVLGILAALFVFAVLLPVGVYAAADNVYALLYDDGTLVFQHGDTPEPGKTVTNTYEVDLNAHYLSADSVPWYDRRESIRVVSFKEKVSPAFTVHWFYKCQNLEHVDNISNLDTSNVTDMSYMFYLCSGLTTLDLSSFDTANVIGMIGMFYNCTNLTALDVSNFNTSNVIYMQQMFLGCRSLTALDVSHFDTTNVTDMRSMFDGCHGLTALDVSHFDTTNVTNMYSMFGGCRKLTVLDVSHFNTANVTNMGDMFFGCDKLTALDLSSFDTANVMNMYRMFYGCSNLRTIYTSGAFTLDSLKDSPAIFTHCENLVGGNDTKYDISHTNREYARIDTPSTPGYFTYKPFAPDVYAIADAVAGNETLFVMFSNPDAATLAVLYFDANGQFVSASLQSVQANAGTVTSAVPANAKTARVMLFDTVWRPLCGAFEAGL